MLLSEEPLLHVGDRLRIVCPEAPALCVDRTIGPDGTIDLPGIGPLPAAVRRVGDLVKRIVEELPLGPSLPHVEIRRLGPAPGQVSIQGAVKRPLDLYAPKGIATERLFAAANLLPEADRARLGLGLRVRAGTALDVPFASADRKISILGAVERPSSLLPAEKLLLSSALDAVGGLTPHADRNGIVVVRRNEPIPLSLPADANFLLQPGDVVRVGLVQDRKFILVKGLVEKPGTVEYAAGMTIKAALAAAGGPTTEATVVVWQTGAKTYRLSLKFLMEGRIPNSIVGPNDSLVVEAGRP